MFKIWCNNNEEFISLQKKLLSQSIKWKGSSDLKLHLKCPLGVIVRTNSMTWADKNRFDEVNFEEISIYSFMRPDLIDDEEINKFKKEIDERI